MNFKTLILTLAALAFSAPAAFAAGSAVSKGPHAKAGVSCEACHGKAKEPAEPTIEQCSACHNPDQLVKKTENVKPRNPHTSPHYQNKLECTNCHQEHGGSENFCAQCHDFKFNVP